MHIIHLRTFSKGSVGQMVSFINVTCTKISIFSLCKSSIYFHLFERKEIERQAEIFGPLVHFLKCLQQFKSGPGWSRSPEAGIEIGAGPQSHSIMGRGHPKWHLDCTQHLLFIFHFWFSFPNRKNSYKDDRVKLNLICTSFFLGIILRKKEEGWSKINRIYKSRYRVL